MTLDTTLSNYHTSWIHSGDWITQHTHVHLALTSQHHPNLQWYSKSGSFSVLAFPSGIVSFICSSMPAFLMVLDALYSSVASQYSLLFVRKSFAGPLPVNSLRSLKFGTEAPSPVNSLHSLKFGTESFALPLISGPESKIHLRVDKVLFMVKLLKIWTPKKITVIILKFG